MDDSCVYWIHLETHTDMFSEGYIGVSVKGAHNRWLQHKSFAKEGSIPLSKAIRKYGDKIIVDTIVKAPIEYCYELEAKLRPTKRIGWNVAEGGIKPPNQSGFSHSDETKKKISEASKKNSHTDAKKAHWDSLKGVKRNPEHMVNSIAKTRSLLPWERGMAKKDLWSIADKWYAIWVNSGCCGSVNFSKIVCLPVTNVNSVINKFRKENWIPLKDPKWVAWASEYKLYKGNNK